MQCYHLSLMTKNKILSGFIWTFGLKATSALIQIGTLAILGRLLTPAIFGTMGILLMIIGFSKIFSEFGLGAALVQKEHIEENEKKSVLFVSLLISGFLALIFFSLSNTIANFFNDQEIVLPLKVISFVFIIDSMVVIQLALAQRQLNFKFIAIVTFIAYFLGNSLVAMLLAYCNFGIWSLTIGYIFSSVITLALYIYKFGLLIPKMSTKNIKQLFSFGSFYTIGGIANYFANNADYFIIGRVLGTQTLGYYTRAFQMMSAPANLLGSTLQKILFPTFSKIQKQTDDIKKYYLISNLILGYLSLTISAVVVFYAESIVNILLGPGWEPTVFPLQALAAGLVFKLGYKIASPVMNAIGLVKTRAYIELAFFVFIITGVYIGSFWGINGAAIGVLAAMAINFFISNFFCIRYLKIQPKKFIAHFYKPLLLATMLLGAMHLIEISIVYSIFYFLFLFMLFHMMFRSNFFKQEFEILRNIKTSSL